MHQFEFHLSRLSKLNAGSAQQYRELGKVLPDDVRPKAEEGLAYLSTKVDKKSLKDADFQEIIERWRTFSFLRDLYTDRDLFKEYEGFRQCSSVWPKLSPELGIPLMEPADARGGVKTSNTKHDRVFDPDFKGNFHKSVVLHSMAMECLQFARRGIDMPFDLKDDYSDALKFEHVVIALWVRFGIPSYGGSGGRFVGGRLLTEIHGLETFDFLYTFLLPKILPFERLASWTGSDASEYPYAGLQVDQRSGSEQWQAFLDLSRWVLRPQDLVELIENRAWTGAYPADKSMYMQTRGMFERGDSSWDCRSACNRRMMVECLRDSPGSVLRGAEENCWWDHLRVHCGSIFSAESLSKYREEFEKLNEKQGWKSKKGRKAARAAAKSRQAALPFIHW